MNKPAPKEPSMDEILSSIRQIIADDDAAGTPRRPAPEPAQAGSSPSSPMAFSPQPAALRPAAPPDSLEDAFLDDDDDVEPLTLSPAQILQMPEPAQPPVQPSMRKAAAPEAPAPEAPQPVRPRRPEPVAEFTTPALVDPEDISFDVEEADAPEPAAFAPPPVPRRDPPPAPRAATPIAEAAPMPDHNLSRDLTEQLIEPATNAAVRQNLQRLNALHIAVPGLTIESMVREMLRPMLKDWLDETLPAMVERMVEKEIARISRGVD